MTGRYQVGPQPLPLPGPVLSSLCRPSITQGLASQGVQPHVRFGAEGSKVLVDEEGGELRVR